MSDAAAGTLIKLRVEATVRVTSLNKDTEGKYGYRIRTFRWLDALVFFQRSFVTAGLGCRFAEVCFQVEVAATIRCFIADTNDALALIWGLEFGWRV